MTLAALKLAIEDVGYQAESAQAKRAKKTASAGRVEFPKSGPAALLRAIEAAKDSGDLIVVDFWATWCAPCIKLKKVTFADQGVAELLQEVEFVLIDLDKHPDLGKAWGVATVPRVFFLTADGEVVDLLKKYEAPGPFKKRLSAAIAAVNP